MDKTFFFVQGGQRQSKATAAASSATAAATEFQSQTSSEQIHPSTDLEKSKSQVCSVVKV